MWREGKHSIVLWAYLHLYWAYISGLQTSQTFLIIFVFLKLNGMMELNISLFRHQLTLIIPSRLCFSNKRGHFKQSALKYLKMFLSPLCTAATRIYFSWYLLWEPRQIPGRKFHGIVGGAPHEWISLESLTLRHVFTEPLAIQQL